jgi:hypothetical protein
VETRYPRDVLKHLEEVRGYTVEEARPGIYHVKGDIIPIQIIESKKLAPGENVYMRALAAGLDKESARNIVEKALRRRDEADIRAYFHVLMRANSQIIREVLEMSDADMTIEEVVEQSGFMARWEARIEARGEEKKGLRLAKNLLDKGFSVEDAAELAEMDIEKVQALL